MENLKAKRAKEKARFNAKRQNQFRVNFWVPLETVEMCNKLADEKGIDRQSWMAAALLQAVQLQLLDDAMTAGTVRGRFGGFGAEPRDSSDSREAGSSKPPRKPRKKPAKK